jgi:hypothetical protein
MRYRSRLDDLCEGCGEDVGFYENARRPVMVSDVSRPSRLPFPYRSRLGCPLEKMGPLFTERTGRDGYP